MRIFFFFLFFGLGTLGCRGMLLRAWTTLFKEFFFFQANISECDDTLRQEGEHMSEHEKNKSAIKVEARNTFLQDPKSKHNKIDVKILGNVQKR